MDDLNNENDDTLTPDDRISALFSTLRREQTPEADFESRFLADFHRQLAEQHPTPSFMERIRRIVSAVWQKRLVYGGSFAGACVMCVAYVAWVSGSDGTASGVNNMQANFAEAADPQPSAHRPSQNRKNKCVAPLFSKKNPSHPSASTQSDVPAPSVQQDGDKHGAEEPENGTLQD